MSLRDELTADIAEAFDTDLADAVSQFTGRRWEASGPPDPINQTQPGDWITYEGRGVFGSFEINIIDGVQILRTDVKLTALQAEVEGMPKIDDEIQKVDPETRQPVGPKHKVIHAGQDPVGATWTLQLRAV